MISKASIYLFIKNQQNRGHQLYYNFIKPHESLFGKTPAEIANVDLNLGNNKWENLILQSIKNEKKGSKNC